MITKNILKKISPTYRKISNEVEPKLKTVSAKLNAVETMMNSAVPKLETVKKRLNRAEPKLKTVSVKLGALKEKIDELAREEGFPHRRSCYSQDGEDVVLASFYEEKPEYKGFYVDIGAFHPLRFSNTHYFYERGWRGINIDAMPGSMKEFNKFRPHDINIEAGISDSKEDLTFFCFEEPALNSFSRKVSEDRIRKGWKLREKKVIKTFPINEILEKNLPEGQHIDFLNIDVEGLDFEILKSLDWKKYRPDFLLIEDLEIVDKGTIGYEKSKMYKFLQEKNYTIMARTRRTLIFRKY